MIVAYLTENKLSPDLHSNSGSWTYCVCQGAKPDLIKRGRKNTRYYRIPPPADLCESWGVIDRGGDVLTPADLESSKTYREAVTEALIKRRPGPYSKKLLAGRVGVASRRTIDSYTKNNAAVIVTEQIVCRPLLFADLPALDDLDRNGFWLKDVKGKKYPPKRGVAEQKLCAGETLRLCQQLCNYYDHVDNQPGTLKKSA